MLNCCDYPTMEKIVLARHNHHFSSWNQARVHVESEPIENSMLVLLRLKQRTVAVKTR